MRRSGDERWVIKKKCKKEGDGEVGKGEKEEVSGEEQVGTWQEHTMGRVGEKNSRRGKLGTVLL